MVLNLFRVQVRAPTIDPHPGLQVLLAAEDQATQEALNLTLEVTLGWKVVLPHLKAATGWVSPSSRIGVGCA